MIELENSRYLSFLRRKVLATPLCQVLALKFDSEGGYRPPSPDLPVPSDADIHHDSKDSARMERNRSDSRYDTLL